MPVPLTIADLSTTAASNSPQGSESIGTNLDDYLRSHAAFIKQVSDSDALKAPLTGTGTSGTWPISVSGNAATATTSSGLLVTSVALFGYSAGAGGTVTQSTSKNTTVSLHKPCGKITMNNAALAAGATVSFVLNSSLIGANDVVIVNRTNSTDRVYRVEVDRVVPGSAVINVTNLTAGSLSDAITLNFSIIKGSIA